MQKTNQALEEKTKHLLSSLEKNEVTFSDVILFINENYDFTPVAFKNASQHNDIGQNEGSAKVFSFAQIQKLNEADTLNLFAEHYQAVLNTPNGHDHANIRSFMKHGWEGIEFENNPLSLKV